MENMYAKKSIMEIAAEKCKSVPTARAASTTRSSSSSIPIPERHVGSCEDLLGWHPEQALAWNGKSRKKEPLTI